jgi:hypothetical protein
MQVAGQNERRWLGGLVLVTACSWGRFLATGSPKVDQSYPSAAAGLALLAGLVVGWGLLVVGWRGFLVGPRPNGPPRKLAYAGLLVAALMLPMLSNDVFSVFAYGSLAARGRDVYTTASGLSDTLWYPWVGQHWNEKVCVYGPSTLVGALPVALGGHSPWLSLAVLRVAWFAPLAAVMELSFRRLRDRPLFHAMVWLNPLWIVEGPGQMHGDLLGVTAVVAGIVLTLGGRRASGWLLYAVALLGKYSFAFTGLWFWLFGARTARDRLVRIPLVAAIVVATGAALFAPFWRGTATITEPIHALGSMNPGGSIVEVVGILVGLATGHGVPHQDAPVQAALEASRAASATTWLVTSAVLRVVTLAVAARLLVGLLRRPHDDRRVALATGALVVAVITLASHRFQSWYLVAALPFFGLHCTEAWQKWWLAVVPLAVATEFIHVLPQGSPVLPVWSAVTNGAVVVVFLWSFRARYLDLLSPATRPAPLDEQPEGRQEGDRGEQAGDLTHDGDGAQAADGPVV